MKTLSLRWLAACAFALIVVGCGGVAPTDQTSLAPTSTTAISFASLEEDEDPCEMDICNPGCDLADPCICYGMCDGGGSGGGGVDPNDNCDFSWCSEWCLAKYECLCAPGSENCK